MQSRTGLSDGSDAFSAGPHCAMMQMVSQGDTGCVLGVVAAGRSPHTFHIHLVYHMLVKHAADLG